MIAARLILVFCVLLIVTFATCQLPEDLEQQAMGKKAEKAEVLREATEFMDKARENTKQPDVDSDIKALQAKMKQKLEEITRRKTELKEDRENGDIKEDEDTTSAFLKAIEDGEENLKKFMKRTPPRKLNASLLPKAFEVLEENPQNAQFIANLKTRIEMYEITEKKKQEREERRLERSKKKRDEL